MTGYSPSQVSRITCSEDFQDRYSLAFWETASKAGAKYQDRLKTANDAPITPS